MKMKIKKMSVRRRRYRRGGGTPKTRRTPKTEKKKTTAQKTPKTDDVLRKSLHFIFTYISDIHKWHDNIDDVVDAYIAMFEKANTFKTSSPSPRSPRAPGS